MSPHHLHFVLVITILSFQVIVTFAYFHRSGLKRLQYYTGPSSSENSSLSAEEDNPFQTRIAGGRSVHVGDVPYHLQLRYKNKHHCGAALVVVSQWKNQVVITAGRCVTKYQTKYLLDKKLFSVVGGRILIDGTHPYEQYRTVTKIVRHHSFDCDEDICYDDIAVLHINEEFQLNRLVQPIALPPRIKVKPSGPLLIAGFGAFTLIDDSVLSKYLRIAVIECITFYECKAAFEHYGNPEGTIYDNIHFCAGIVANKQYQGPCNKGDKGGPAAAEFNNTLYLAGLFQYHEPKCGNRYQPSVFTAVDWYVETFIPNAAKP